MRRWIRWAIVLLLAAWAIRAGVIVYQATYDLLSFQIIVYKAILEAQLSVGGVVDQIQDAGYQAATWFGRATDSPDQADRAELIVEDRLRKFAWKIQVIAAILGTVVSFLVFYVGFTIVMTLKQQRRNISLFITKDIHDR